MYNIAALFVTAVLSLGMATSSFADEYVSNEVVKLPLELSGPKNSGEETLELVDAAEMKLDSMVRRVSAEEIADLIIFCEEGYGIAKNGGLGRVFSYSARDRGAELARLLDISIEQAELLLPYLSRNMSYEEFKSAIEDAELEIDALKGLYYELVAERGMAVARSLGFLEVKAAQTLYNQESSQIEDEVCLADYDNSVKKKVSKISYSTRYDHSAWISIELNIKGVTLTESEKEQLYAKVSYKQGFQFDIQNRTRYHDFRLSDVKVERKKVHGDEKVQIVATLTGQRMKREPRNDVSVTAYYQNGELMVEFQDPAAVSELKDLIGEASVEFGVYKTQFILGWKTLYYDSVVIDINKDKAVINTGLTEDDVDADEIYVEWTINRPKSALYQGLSSKNDSGTFVPGNRN